MARAAFVAVLLGALIACAFTLDIDIPVKRQSTFCELCIEQGVAIVNELLNEILNNGIVYDCGQLCGYLKNKYEQDACDVMCDGVGIYEFIEAIENVDFDAILIYGCQLFDACPISDCKGQCMNVTKAGAHPPVAPAGATIHVSLLINITEPWTGTGVFRVVLTFPDGSQSMDDQLIAGGIGPVGMQAIDIPIKTSSNGQGTFPPGEYTVEVQICNGNCDTSGKIPHNQQLALVTVKFKLTNN